MTTALDQPRREMLVGCLLDITVAQYRAFLDALPEDLDAAVPADVQQPLANLVQWLEGGDGQAYIQQIALLADDSLHTIVRLVTGADPLAA